MNEAPEYAHRYAYELAKGPIPRGMTIDHLCRHKWCVKPSHLELVSRKVNTLRGISGSAQNARKQECPNGHPFVNHKGKRGNVARYCPICANANARAKRRAAHG